MEEKTWLRLIIGLFVVLGVTYAMVTPVFEASDELWHYPMIRHLADGNPLPVQVFDPADAGPWKQEASQPPLYYYLGAALTFWIDASDMETVRWENPHVDNGVLTTDGNNNLIVHDPTLNPWQGTLLAVRIVRVFSVLLGAATVYLTYLIAKTAVSTKPHLVLGVTAVTAFMPMFLFISGAVNNDNLIVPLAALALLIMIQAVVHERLGGNNQQSTRTWIILGVVIGLAALTKLSGIGLLPLAWGTIFVTRWQVSERKVTGTAVIRWLVETTVRWLVVLLPVILIAGWWYWRNVQLYGDWRGWSAFIAVLGQRAHPASLRQLWAERWGFMLSYWGLFGGVNIPMWTWIYRVLNAVVAMSVFGFVIYLVRELWEWRLFSKLASKFKLPDLIATLLDLVVDYFPIVVCLLWAGAVVYGIVDWATITWSSQGRLVFSALPALSLLL
ncbi:MAG: glycosyltransferase family 39 protein, partial [Chloroflexi bacterium]|nr:glycosyltransferase family 39 protein [Chloroflexota bacterium]